MDPLISENTPFAIQADFDGNIWISILNKDKIIKYLPELEKPLKKLYCQKEIISICFNSRF